MQATDAATLAPGSLRTSGHAWRPVLGLLRTAVEGMRSDAAAARPDLDVRLIESVCQRGRQAVTELRWLLGILRSEPDRPPDAKARSPGRTVTVIVAVGLLVLGVLELWFQVWDSPTPLAWTLAVVLPVCTVVRGRLTAARLLVAAAGVGAALLTGVLPTVANLFCIVLLAWSAGTAAHPVWLIFGALAAGMAVWGAQHYAGNWPFTLALLALPAFAGYEWSAQDRAARTASAQADELRADTRCTCRIGPPRGATSHRSRTARRDKPRCRCDGVTSLGRVSTARTQP